MTSRESSVHYRPTLSRLANEGSGTRGRFDQFPDVTVSREVLHRADHAGRIDHGRFQKGSVNSSPRRARLPYETRRSSVTDWLFSATVRQNALVITTFCTLGFGAWLLATEVVTPSGSQLDFSTFSSSNESEIQSSTVGSVSTTTLSRLAVAQGTVNNGPIPPRSALGEPVADPATSADGLVQLAVARTADGWSAVVDQTEAGEALIDQIAAVRVLVNGEMVGKSSGFPLDLDIADTGVGDASTVIVSAIVDWPDTGTPSSPVSVAVPSSS